MIASEKNKQPAYREPWFWMVFGPLIVVVLFSCGFIYVAFVGADDRVFDDYYKQGRMINNRFAAETRARELGLGGVAQFDFSTGEVLVDLQGQQLPGELKLQISHPAEARQDAETTLTRTGEYSYRGSLPREFDGSWYLIFTAGAGESSWRITAEADFSQSATVPFAAHL